MAETTDTATDAPAAEAGDGGTDGVADDAGDAGASDAADATDGSTDGAVTGDAGDAADAPEPDVDSIPWVTGASVGNGVAAKDTLNPRGQNAAIIYGGLGSTLGGAEGWTTALYRATLRDRGVRYLWAVQGPADLQYTMKEIGNSKIVASLLTKVSASTKFVLVAGHSSGSYVAHELLGQLAGGGDPGDLTKGKVVYFDLDGATGGLDSTVVARLRKAYFVGSFDANIVTYSPNDVTMRSAGTSWSNAAYYTLTATGSGCITTAIWCVHMTVVTTKPHNPSAADVINDYDDFAGRPVARAYIDDNATAAGLNP